MARFSIESVFRAVDKVTAPVTRMQNRVNKFTRSAARGFNKANRAMDKFSTGLKRNAVGILAVGTAVAFLGANVLGAGADFEQAITNVGAVSLQTRDQIKPLEALAKQLGKTTKFTATQSAQAMEIMARAGFKMNEIIEATPAVLSAAAASGLEIAEVANHVSNVLKGMGLATSEAAKVADVLALASARTNSTIGTLGESMKNVSSTASQLNIPLEEVIASVALLQDVGLDASVAGSAMNVMLTKMAAPTSGMIKKMRRLGISFKDAKGNMKPLGDVIDQLNVASKKVGGNFDKVAFLAELVGLRGQKAAANLGKLFETGKLQKLTKELKNANGSAERMSKIRMNTVTGSMLLLGSAVDGVKIKISEMNEGPLKDTIDNFTKWVGVNEELIATNIGGFLAKVIENFDEIVTAIAGLGQGVLAIIGLSIALKAVAAVLGIINLVMAANPIVLGILAAVAAVALLSGALDPVLKIIKSIGGGISSAFKSVSSLGKLFGFGDHQQQVELGPQMVSPQARVANSIEEKRQTSTATVTIKDETGKAKVTNGNLNNSINLESTGEF